MNKIILWDFDGTLGYRDGNWEEAIFELTTDKIVKTKANFDLVSKMLQSGFPWHEPQKNFVFINNSREWWEYVEPRFSEIFTALGYDLYESRVKAAQVKEYYPKLDKWKLYSDTIPGLTQLQNHQWTNVLVTNNVPEFPLILDHLNLTPFFEAVFVSSLVGFNKPNPLILDGYLETLKDHSKIIVVGDREDSDLELAKALKVEGILIHVTKSTQALSFDNIINLTRYLLSLNID